MWVSASVMRMELAPRRLAVYATVENYQLLGLPPVDHHIHEHIPKNIAEHYKMLAKYEWEEEPWKFSFAYLYRNHPETPMELQDDASPWDGIEDIDVREVQDEQGNVVLVKQGGSRRERKAKKIQLFV